MLLSSFFEFFYEKQFPVKFFAKDKKAKCRKKLRQNKTKDY